MLAAMEQQIRFCTTSDGVRIAYATVGEGPPLVLIPGWVSHLEVMWEYPPLRSRVEALARHVQYVCFDKRGTGLSDRNVSDFSVDARVRDVEAVVDHLKLRTFALWGFSEGGPAAIAYAARHPRRVSRLILYGTRARVEMTAERRRLVDALEALVRAEWGLGSRTLADLFMPGASQEEVDYFVRLQREGATAEDAVTMGRANMQADVSHLLSQVRAPTLVIHLRADKVVPFEGGRDLAGSILKARLLPIEGDRHAWPDDAAWAQIHQAVIDFVPEEQRPLTARRSGRPSLESGPVTILFTDMESSTALTQRLGDAQAQELVRAHNRIVREALKQHGGSEIKHTGDGIMASFASASRALECAVAIQRGVAQRDDAKLAVHIGVNAGEPVAEEQDLFGTAVQLARRICDHAEGGEIIASDVVRQLVAGKGFLFADRGEVALRGFEDPVRLYEVRWQQDG